MAGIPGLSTIIEGLNPLSLGNWIRGGVAAKVAVGAAKRFLTKTPAMPGIGSKVTKGALKVGGQTIYGAKPGISTAAKIAGAVGAGGVGLATVASHRLSGLQKKPATSPQPRPSRPSKKSTAKGSKLCCPAGTKRKVCFKRDVDPAAEKKRKAKSRTAKARAIKRGRKSVRKKKAKAKRKARK